MDRVVVLIITLCNKFRCELPASQGKMEIIMDYSQIINERKFTRSSVRICPICALSPRRTSSCKSLYKGHGIIQKK